MVTEHSLENDVLINFAPQLILLALKVFDLVVILLDLSIEVINVKELAVRLDKFIDRLQPCIFFLRLVQL